MSSLIQFLTVLTEKKLILISSLNLSFQLVPIMPHSPNMHRYKEPGFIIFITLRYWRAAIRSPQILFPRSYKPSALSLSPCRASAY